MTAYALMASIVHVGKDNIAALIPIVQWMSRQRNANGGFSSTQVIKVKDVVYFSCPHSFTTGLIQAHIIYSANSLTQLVPNSALLR